GLQDAFDLFDSHFAFLHFQSGLRYSLKLIFVPLNRMLSQLATRIAIIPIASAMISCQVVISPRHLFASQPSSRRPSSLSASSLSARTATPVRLSLHPARPSLRRLGADGPVCGWRQASGRQLVSLTTRQTCQQATCHSSPFAEHDEPRHPTGPQRPPLTKFLN